MRPLLRSLRSLIHKLTAPESVALVHVPAPTGVWLRVIPRGSEVTRAYEFKCLCSQEHLYSADEAHVSTVHRCGCGREFSLLRSLDAIDPAGNVNLAALTHGLHNLAIKPVAQQQPQGPRHVEVGNEKVRDPWSGKQDGARGAAFDAGDPGYTNLF